MLHSIRCAGPVVIGLMVLCQGAIAQVLFSDQTASQGIQFTHAKVGGDGMPMGAGGAVGDYDGDGWLDLFLAQGNGPNHLYHNTGSGFVTVAAAAGVEDALGQGTGGLFGDYDNDGDQDLYVLNRGDNVLFRNDGPDGSGGWIFTDVTSALGVQAYGRSTTAVYGDYDNDGFLDLYVANHSYPGAMPQPGETNRCDFLFHNVEGLAGERVFVDVTAATLDVALLQRSISHTAGFFDQDNDGDLDLFVSNEDMRNSDPVLTGENLLFRNDGPDGNGGWLFTEVGASAGVVVGRQPMGLAIGDYNADGWLDLALSDNGPNALLQNLGGTFAEVAAAAGVDRPLIPGGGTQQITWGMAFLDANLDGSLDLFAGAGSFGGVPGQQNGLFLHDGNYPSSTFSESIPCGADGIGKARGVACGDFDNDGDQDLLEVNLKDQARLYRNDSDAAFLSVRLVGTLSNRDGIGARLRLQVTGLPDQYRMAQSGSSTGASHDPRLVFAMGTASVADVLTVDWPSGQQSVLTGIATRQFLTVVEPCPASWNSYGSGLAGTLGVPGLTPLGNPVIGQPLDLSIGNSAGSATVALLLIGLQAASLPGSWGSDLLLLPISSRVVALPAGGVDLSGSLPDDEALCGVSLLLQALEADTGAPRGISATHGVDLHLGAS